MKKRHFTLLELMAAMIVLVIMMGFLFKFITSSQQLWSASDRNARIYENARIFFEVLGRDLTGAVASDASGREITFWVGKRSGFSAPNDFLAFATMSPCGTPTSSNLWETHYRGTVTSGSLYAIERVAVGDRVNTTGNAANVNWDFYGNTKVTTSPVPDWVRSVGPTGTVDWQEIIDGVQDLDITYVGASGTTGWNTDDTLHNELPVAVRVKLTLVDQQIQELALPANVKQDRLKGSERVFVKAFFLPRKQF